MLVEEGATGRVPRAGGSEEDSFFGGVRPPSAAARAAAIKLSRPPGRGTVFQQDSTSRTNKCSPVSGYQTRVCRSRLTSH
jgi:hypothetical protein